VTDTAAEQQARSQSVVDQVTGSPDTGGRWHRVRQGAALIYLAALVAIVIFTGVPTGRQTIAVIILVGLSISRIGRGWRAFGQVYLDWLPFTAVLIVYDRTRGVADAVGMPLHEADVLGWEKALFGGHVPTVWLQQQLYDPHAVHWYDALCTVTYTSHFVVTPVLGAVLWMRNRTVWLQFISRIILLSVAGLATYVLFPEAPPWMAADHGLVGAPVHRLTARGWSWLHAETLRTTLDHAQRAGSNPVAAMPSLHVGFACLIAVFVGCKVHSRWRWLLALYPLAMGFALVYLGEHYVVDLIAGCLYAVATHLALNAWERRRQRRSPIAPAVAAPTR
jgi:membrane-associated phospholipid phosphatase